MGLLKRVDRLDLVFLRPFCPSPGSPQRNASSPCSPPCDRASCLRSPSCDSASRLRPPSRGGAPRLRLPSQDCVSRLQLPLISDVSHLLPSSHGSASRLRPYSRDSAPLPSLAFHLGLQRLRFCGDKSLAVSVGTGVVSVADSTSLVGAPQHQQIRLSWRQPCYAHSATLTNCKVIAAKKVSYITRVCTPSTSLCSADLAQAHVNPNTTTRKQALTRKKTKTQPRHEHYSERGEVDVGSPKMLGRSYVVLVILGTSNLRPSSRRNRTSFSGTVTWTSHLTSSLPFIATTTPPSLCPSTCSS